MGPLKNKEILMPDLEPMSKIGSQKDEIIVTFSMPVHNLEAIVKASIVTSTIQLLV